MTTKKCVACQKRKSKKSFGPHKSSADGLNPRCRECANLYHRERRKRVAAETRARVMEPMLREQPQELNRLMLKIAHCDSLTEEEQLFIVGVLRQHFEEN